MDEQRAWAIQVCVLATDVEVQTVVERIGLAICPEPDHDGPCMTPWDITTTPVDHLDLAERKTWLSSVETLTEQRLNERRRR